MREGRGLRERAVTANRELTDSERLEAFRLSLFGSHLPDLPAIDGYHSCWLTTSNVQDPVHARIRIGFQLIQAEELPSFEHCKQVGGSYPGCIMVNEMIAAKIPLDLWNQYMAINHHERPMDEAGKMKRTADSANEELAGSGARVLASAGAREMAQDPGAPDFRRMYGELGEPYAPHEIKMRRRLESYQTAEDFEEDSGDFQ
jgi:hypothetical protein